MCIRDRALIAARAGADYLGIGTVYATLTKENSKHIIGPSGLRSILTALFEDGQEHVGTVCIGGVNPKNVQRVLWQSTTPQKRLNGAAIVSAIMAAPDPKAASAQLLDLIKSPPPFRSQNATALEGFQQNPPPVDKLLKSIPQLFADLVPSFCPWNLYFVQGLYCVGFAA